jgi:hypothetical protein
VQGDGCVKGITSLELTIPVQQITRGIEDLQGDREDDWNDPPGKVVNAPPFLSSLNGSIPVEDFLKDFRIQNCFNFPKGNPLEILPTGLLVRVLGAGRVHEDVGVDQDQRRRSSGRGTDSRSISSGSPTGRCRRANSRTASNRSSMVVRPY